MFLGSRGFGRSGSDAFCMSFFGEGVEVGGGELLALFTWSRLDRGC